MEGNTLITALTIIGRVVRDEIERQRNSLTADQFNVALKTYNAFEEAEHCGVDHIFDLHDKEDLKCMIDGGITLAELARLHNEGARYCFFGENHQKPVPLTTPLPLTTEEVKEQIINRAESITAYALLYNQDGRFGEWLATFITTPMVEDDALYDQFMRSIV